MADRDRSLREELERPLLALDGKLPTSLFQRDGRMAMLDYGSTREFERAFVQNLAALTRAVHADTRDALHGALRDLGIVTDGQNYDFETARGLVRSFYGPMLRDETLAVEPPTSF